MLGLCGKEEGILVGFKIMKKNKRKKLGKEKSLWDRYGHKAISAPEYKDSVKYIREMRNKE